MKVRRYVPPGGYGFEDGMVMSRSEVTEAIRLYARHHGFYARTVRTITVLKRAAMREWRERG